MPCTSEGNDMDETGAAARAAGIETTAEVLMTHGPDALLRLPSEEEAVRWPAAEVTEGTGVPLERLAGLRLLVTVRETQEDGRVLSGFRLE